MWSFTNWCKFFVCLWPKHHCTHVESMHRARERVESIVSAHQIKVREGSKKNWNYLGLFHKQRTPTHPYNLGLPGTFTVFSPKHENIICLEWSNMLYKHWIVFAQKGWGLLTPIHSQFRTGEIHIANCLASFQLPLCVCKHESLVVKDISVTRLPRCVVPSYITHM